MMNYFLKNDAYWVIFLLYLDTIKRQLEREKENIL
jgi:hypothetical protein